MNRKGGTIGNIDDLAMVGYRLNTFTFNTFTSSTGSRSDVQLLVYVISTH